MKKIFLFIINLFKRNIFFIGSTDILPEPLSKDMEDFYVSLWLC